MCGDNKINDKQYLDNIGKHNYYDTEECPRLLAGIAASPSYLTLAQLELLAKCLGGRLNMDSSGVSLQSLAM